MGGGGLSTQTKSGTPVSQSATLIGSKTSQNIRETMNWIKTHIRVPDPSFFQKLAYFVPWNLEKNRPLFSIDNANAPYLEKIWVA